MTDSNIVFNNSENEEVSEVEALQECDLDNENNTEAFLQNAEEGHGVITEILHLPEKISLNEFSKESFNRKNENTTAFIRTILTSIDCPKNSVEVFEKLNCENLTMGNDMVTLKQTVPVEAKQEDELPVKEGRSNTEDEEYMEDADDSRNIECTGDMRVIREVEVREVDNEEESEDVAGLQSGLEKTSTSSPFLKEKKTQLILKKFINLPEGYTDSSHSSSSEVQLLAAPCESSCSSQGNMSNIPRTDFENVIPSDPVWNEINKATDIGMSESSEHMLPKPSNQLKGPQADIPLITIDDNTESASATMPPPGNTSLDSGATEAAEFIGPIFPAPELKPKENIDTSNDAKLEQSEVPAAEVNVEVNSQPNLETPQPVPVVVPTPRKRGRPRKQVLPNPSPLVESWGPEFLTMNVPVDPKRATRSERRQTKRRKFEEDKSEKHDGSTPKKRLSGKPPVKKKKKRTTYVPKKRIPAAKKKHSELENIQNFEEETRMSASEGQGGYSSRSGAMGDESQGSSATTDGHTKSNVNKKGRMEVLTDGCKPITVQQIVEYHWPPPSFLPHGEKPEGLMIQEQITEYLGVKSFKRKYPSIKRRPVEMEERNYLQENGFVSENMCDMGLTAVYSSDILEIMYNDFPQKFEEYRKYAREKKAKEQRALREKQAAERADMDPIKEAVESAQTWNMEFNKTRRFKLHHVRPELRELTDGRPCSPFEEVVIYHAPNNSLLSVENTEWMMSLFCYECEVSANTKGHQKNQVDPSNKWMFLVGSL